MGSRKLTQKQIRYLWAVGYFKKPRGSVKPKKDVFRGDITEVRSQLIERFSGKSGYTGYSTVINREEYEIHFDPERSDRFKISLKDRHGETARLSFFQEEIERDGLKLHRQGERPPERRREGFDPKLAPDLANRDREQLLGEYQKRYPKHTVTIQTPDPRGLMTDLGVKDIDELVNNIAPGVREKFPDYTTSISISTRKDEFTGNTTATVFTRFDHPDRPGDRHAVEVVREYDIESKTAYHESLQLPKEFQGQGFGKKIYEQNMEYARRIGMKRVQLLANCDVGGYMWGRMGFDFQREDQKKKFNQKLHFALREAEAKIHPDDKKIADRLVGDTLRGRLSAKEIADVKLRDIDGKEIKFGAEVLLGSSWRGVKNLDD